MLRPTSRPSASSSGLPELPRASGAVCSMLPVTARPRGPRKVRSTPLTNPKVTRGVPARVSERANTASPRPAGSLAHSIDPAAPVSTDRTTRSPSGSTPLTSPCSDRPSAKVTEVVRSRRLCALVSTAPSAMTMPAPRPPWRPTRTTDGLACSAMRRAASATAVKTVSVAAMGRSPTIRQVTCI